MSKRQSSPAKPTAIRCAIYTRTSSDERLRQEFNSLDAQREACGAYIASQRSRGWTVVEHYSDGGFSGKNSDRPALQRLIADVKSGKIDVVIVYKLDRVSRFIRDFLALAGLFEQNSVAVVSVTQAFDTNTPMGRLTMHILLSFAEFEREVIGERIRDKLAASRAKGKWTGGTPVLGYDVDRSGPSPRLVVNPVEAARVLEIFELYLERGSLLPVVAELIRRDWRCKEWTTRDGRSRGGLPFDKCRVHDLLTNPIYLGQVRHKDVIHPGEHEPIVPVDLFERVQQQLKRNAARNSEHRNRHGALLRGLLFCRSCSRAMSHTFTRRGSKSYRYYACTRRVKRGRAACPSRPLPVGEIERLVIEDLRGIGRDPKLISEVAQQVTAQLDAERKRLENQRRMLRRAAPPDVERLAELESQLAALGAATSSRKQVAEVLADFDRLWAGMTPREQARVVRLLVGRVEFDAATGDVAITLNTDGVQSLAADHGEAAA